MRRGAKTCRAIRFIVLGLQVGVVTDIRGRRSTAEAMHLCDKALAATSEAIVITDPNCADNPIVYCNAGFEKLTGESAVRPGINLCPQSVCALKSVSRRLQGILRCAEHHLLKLGMLKKICVKYSSCCFESACLIHSCRAVCAGFSKNEVIGRNCRFMQGPDTDPAALAELRSAIAAQQPVIVELINYRKDGSKFWNQARLLCCSSPGMIRLPWYSYSEGCWWAASRPC